MTEHFGVPAVLGPLARPLADARGLPLLTVLMTQVVGFSAMLLPYISAPVTVAIQLANVGLAAATKLSLLLGGLTLLLLTPLAYLWWRYLRLFRLMGRYCTAPERGRIAALHLTVLYLSSAEL